MLYFVTENKPKFDNAQIVLSKFDISLTQYQMSLVEIQSDSLKEIAKYKADQAYEKLKKPLVAKDDGWYITALKGFPGSYMKQVNNWFSPNDFLNLTKSYSNKEVLFKDALCYTDGKIKKIFESTIIGRIINIPRGEGVSFAQLVTFRKDGKTMAECINEGIHFAENGLSVWERFAKWYKVRK